MHFSNVLRYVSKLMFFIDKVMETIVFLLFLCMVLIGGLQVFNRFILNNSLSWSAEFQRFAHIWLIFLTIPVAYNRGEHIGMNILLNKFPESLRNIFNMIIHILWLIFACAVVVYTRGILKIASNQLSAGIGIRMDIVYSGLIIGGIYLGLCSIRKLIAHILRIYTAESEGSN